MKTWQIYLLILAVIFFIVNFLPEDMFKPVTSLLVFGTSYWAYKDSKKLQISKYKKTWLTPSTSPTGVLVICAAFWLIAFPAYISYRQKIVEGKIPLKTSEVNGTNNMTATGQK